MAKKSYFSFWTFIFFLLVLCIFKKGKVEGFTNDEKQDLFDVFMTEHYSNIFPDRGRNSGGPMFYHYFVNNMDIDQRHFKLYNQFYCGVSGSIVSPNRSGGNITNNVVLKDLNGQEWFGKYYRCCTPCPCDIMRYAKVEQHTVDLSDGPYPHYVITIDDPCITSEEIPPEVTAYQCSDSKTQNGIRTTSGRLIIGVLFGQNEMEEQPVHFDPNTHTVDADQYCQTRICQQPEDLSGGMGDIFVLLSLVGNNEIPPSPERFNCGTTEPFDNQMNNVYGEPLEPCRNENNATDSGGSWDCEGYCSELGGGVHQICFDVNQNTEQFSSQTGQSDWSLSRSGKNHCMCLGAWALYKAKQSENLIPETNDELNCNSIPEISLTDNYVNNWNTWNGNELPDQIVQGVNKLVEQCYYKENNPSKKEYLKQKYLSLIENKSEFIGHTLSL